MDAARVRYVWQMTEAQYEEIKRVKDDFGVYLWAPGDYGKRGTVCGMDVVFADVCEPKVVVIVPEDATQIWG